MPAPTAPLASTQTRVAARVASSLDVGDEAFGGLLSSVKPDVLAHELAADIGGLRIDLRTDNAHLAEFWANNWHPSTAPVADGVLWAVASSAQPAHAWYSPGRNEALLLNTDYYGQCKSWALGVAGAILERRLQVHSIHGASVEVGGRAIVIVGGTGSGKSTQVAALCKNHAGRLLGDDWAFVTPDASKTGLRVTQPERMLYIRADNAARDTVLAHRLRSALLENVVTERGACSSPECKAGNCMLDRGEGFCLWGHPNARALVPREWLAGSNGLADAAPFGRLAVLYRDANDPRGVTTDAAEVLRFLRTGPSEVRPGAGPRETWGTMSRVPYYNPYLLAPDATFQDAAFAREATLGACLVNTAHLNIEATATAIANAAR